MAQKVTVSLTDDMDGTEAGETVKFSLDSASYEIDLSAKNAAAFRVVMGPYTENARRTAAPGNRRAPRGTESRRRSSGIRAWARERGIEVNERGRIPAAVLAEFDQAHR
jgi:hypothetical protein